MNTKICIIPADIAKEVGVIVRKHYPEKNIFIFPGPQPEYSRLLTPDKLSYKLAKEMEAFTLGVIAGIGGE